MDKYYYFVSQLPMLMPGKAPEISKDDFLAEAGKWLSTQDLQQVKDATLSSTAIQNNDNPVLKTWKSYEFNLRSDVAELRRARKQNQEYKPAHFQSALVKDADPLQAEKNLLNLRWEQIEALETGHYFDIEYVILYSLKLQILQRLSGFNKETGMENFKHFTEIGV